MPITAVQHLSPAAQTTVAAAFSRRVGDAFKDIQKIQGRMTEELRAEDAIRGLHVGPGNKITADIDGRYDYKAAGLRHTVAEHLAKHGIKNVTISLHTLPDPQKAVEGAMKDIEKVQARLTRDLRPEDGVSALSVGNGNKINVVLKAHQHFGDADVTRAVKEHLAKHGLNATLEFIRPAINIRPIRSVVDEAWQAIQKVQGRLTTDIRAEDDILNITMGGHGGTSPGEVRVVLKAHPHFSEKDIKKVVDAHLVKAGFENADISFIRPRVDPFGPRPNRTEPVVTAPSNKMKAKVDVFAADIRTVQSRMTEEIRVEDAVKTIKVVGAKVVLTLHTQGPWDRAGVEDWAKDELKKRGVTLPLVVKG